MKIKSIQIQNLHNNGKLYEVGKCGVCKIKSHEYNEMICYSIGNKTGDLIAVIENCPVLVEYDVPENEKPKQSKLFEEKPVKFNFKKSLIELGADQQIATDYMKHRTKKKLSDTLTAFNTLKNQLLLAKSMNYSIDKCLTAVIDGGWLKFKAEWMNNQNKTQNEPEKKLSTKF